jgi:hypothetical protein
MAFRALQAPAGGLPGVSGGIHYFIVCIHDDRVPINPIPHKYLIEPDGTIGHNNFAGLTRQERDDYGRQGRAGRQRSAERNPPENGQGLLPAEGLYLCAHVRPSEIPSE